MDGVNGKCHRLTNDFFANVRHVQWAISQICSEGSIFIRRTLHYRYDRSKLRKHTRNFDAAGYKLIFDNQTKGTEDKSDSKKAVMLDEREATYRSEDANNLLHFMTVQCIKRIISSINFSLYSITFLCNRVR